MHHYSSQSVKLDGGRLCPFPLPFPFRQESTMFRTEQTSRREFLSQVGRGMIVASVGSALATDMGLSPAFAADQLNRVQFGKLEPLVDLLQSTQLNKLLPLVVDKIKAGTSLKELTAAAALANARAFGGEDYIGFHT